MLRLRKAGALVAVAAVLTAGACGDSGSEDIKSSFGKNEPMRDRTMKLQYSLVLDGDLDVKIDKEIEVRVMTVAASSPQISISLLSFGPAAPLEIPGGRRLRTAFDLTGYKGDGTYKIQLGSPRDRLAVAEAAKKGEKVGAPNQSNVLIQYWPTEDVKLQPEIFDDVTKECPLEVSKDGTEGVLTCEKVLNQAGDKSVSLELRWKRTANTAKTERTLPPPTAPPTGDTTPTSATPSTTAA